MRAGRGTDPAGRRYRVAMHPTIRTACVAPALLLLLPGAPEDLALAPEEGLSVRKTFTNTLSIELVEAEFLQDGESQDGPGEMEHVSTTTRELTVTDTYAAVGDDGPTTVSRHFDAIAGSSVDEVSNEFMGDETFESEVESELEGLTVVFTAEDDEWVAAFGEDDDGEDEDLLIGLEADVDFTALLPGGSVEVGDGWEVDVEAFAPLLEPGGFLKAAPTDVELEETWAEIADVRSEIDFDGDVSATLEAVRDGVAVITFDVELEETDDQTESMRAQAEAAGGGDEEMMIPEFDEVVEVNTYEGEGTLTWDLELGIPVELELELDCEREARQVMSLDLFGELLEIEQNMTFEGTLTATATWEVVE